MYGLLRFAGAKIKIFGELTKYLFEKFLFFGFYGCWGNLALRMWGEGMRLFLHDEGSDAERGQIEGDGTGGNAETGIVGKVVATCGEHGAH